MYRLAHGATLHMIMTVACCVISRGNVAALRDLEAEHLCQHSKPDLTSLLLTRLLNLVLECSSNERCRIILNVHALSFY